MSARLQQSPGGGGGRYIFVSGSARSGTTLLQNILDTHHDVTGMPEFTALHNIVAQRRQFAIHLRKHMIDEICTKEEVNQRFAAFIESFLDPLLERAGSRYLSEKTPSAIRNFEFLLEIFPRARFVAMIRDPRAIISSMLEVGKKGTEKGKTGKVHLLDVQKQILRVSQDLEATQSVLQNDPGRVHLVIYEQLVAEPKAVTTKLCDFLDIPWDSRMLTPGDFEHMGARAITSDRNSEWYDPDTYYRNPDQDSVEKWKANLSIAHQVIITRAFENSPELNALASYDFSLGHLNVLQKLEGLVASVVNSVFRRRPKHFSGSQVTAFR